MPDNKVALPDSLRAIAVAIEDTRRTIKETEEKVRRMDLNLDKLEVELERQVSVQERITREIQKLKNEMETVRTSVHTTEQAKTAVQNFFPVQAAVMPTPLQMPVHDNSQAPNPAGQESEIEKPVMPGAGFSHITIDYLKKLSER